MKITNKNLRAAKRRYNNYVPRYVRDFVWPQGFNGTSSSDFDHIERVSTNRTHEKSEKRANDKENDSIGESP